MPVANTDIKLKHSIKTGAAGNTLAQADPNASLGKYISTTEVSGTPLNNMFDNITGAENAAGVPEYRCLFIHNDDPSNRTITAVGIYISAETAGGGTVAIAVDNIAASPMGSSSAQAAEIATETSVPTGVGAFSSPATAGAALSLGALTSDQVRALWVRRTPTGTAADADGFSLAVTFDSPE